MTTALLACFAYFSISLIVGLIAWNANPFRPPNASERKLAIVAGLFWPVTYTYILFTVLFNWMMKG